MDTIGAISITSKVFFFLSVTKYAMIRDSYGLVLLKKIVSIFSSFRVPYFILTIHNSTEIEAVYNLTYVALPDLAF